MLIDTHTHLETFARAGTLVAALARAREAGVDRMITIGTSPDDWKMYQGIAAVNSASIAYSVGLHPCSVDEHWEAALSQLSSFWEASENPRPVALGEIGLDRFHLPKDDPAAAGRIFEWQRSAFQRGLELAQRLACPVVIHSRGAFHECVELIDAARIDWRKVVFHCFTEGETEMRELISRGGFGSFTGILTYKNADSVRAAAKLQGLSRLMIETDAPYLTPTPHRGKPNEPAYLRYTANFAADQFGVSYEDFARVTTRNAKQFFGLE